MKFKVLLRKRGGARARAAGLFGDQTFRWFMLSKAYLSCFMTRHTVVELVELSADASIQAGGEWGAWLGMQVRQSARPLTWCCRCIR